MTYGRLTVENEAHDGRAAYIVAFMATGCGDPTAEKQLPGRGVQQDMSRTLNCKSVCFPATLIPNNTKAGNTFRRVPQIPLFPISGNSVRNCKDNSRGDPVLGSCQKTVQFMETCTGTGTVGMSKKHERQLI